MGQIIKAAPLEDHLKDLEEKAIPIPDHIAEEAAYVLIGLAKAWLESEDGKKEMKRRKINQLHRKEYKAKKAAY